VPTEPYRDGLIRSNPYADRIPVRGRVVAVLDLKLANRGIQILAVPTRALTLSSIHELICTDSEVSAGSSVDSVGFVAFFEVTTGGIARAGDSIVLGRKEMGTLVGFDDTHAPNHMNILFKRKDVRTGKELGLRLSMPVVINPGR
jgi:hypothetical protein